MISVYEMLREQEGDALQSKRSTMRTGNSQAGLDAAGDSSSRFRDCFWGEQAQGYEVLSEKMKTGLSICKQLIVFFENFAKLEEEHGKALVKLTQASHKGMGRDAELQTLHNCLTHMNDCRYEQLGKTHQLLATRISEELVALKTFRAEQKVIKKREDEAMQRAVKLLDKEARSVDKANAYYNTRHRNVVQLQEMIQKNPTDNASKKETLKLQEKLAKAKKEAEQASADYKLAVIRWTEARHAWEERMLAACDVIQAIEQQRIAFIKARLGRLITCQEEAATTIVSEILKGILDKIEKIDPHLDLQNFIIHRATGTEKPLVLTFVDFFSGQKSRRFGDGSRESATALVFESTIAESATPMVDRAPIATPSSLPMSNVTSSSISAAGDPSSPETRKSMASSPNAELSTASVLDSTTTNVEPMTNIMSGDTPHMEAF